MSNIQLGWIMPMPGEREILPKQVFLTHLARGLRLITGHFHSAWCSDHLQFANTPLLESWTMLTYLVPLYPHLHFGTLVLNQAFRNPALLAKMAATLHYMSDGRLLFGIGAGWNEEEHRAYGYAFPSGSTRVAELEEVLHIIKELWRNERTTVGGKYHQVVDARSEPKPVPAPPVVVGGSKPGILRVVARHADWWNADRASLTAYQKQIEICEKACFELKRDPALLRRTWSGGCICRLRETDLLPLRKDYPDEYGFIGTPAQIIEKMQPFIDLGVDYFMLHTGGFPDLTTLELLCSEVLPALNR